MSSIRLFILSCFAEIGPMHGHRLRLEAEGKRLPLWTDISVGAVYGAINRLASEGLLRELLRETEGKRRGNGRPGRSSRSRKVVATF